MSQRTVTAHKPSQRIRYLRADDGVQLAWAEAGSGPTLVKAAHWLTHLQYEWESPLWWHWLEFLMRNFRTIRYDERGCGMSDRDVGDVEHERSSADLEQVVDAAAPDGKLTLLGISHGAAAAIQYAVRHPERVDRLLIYGGFARGIMHSDNEPAKRRFLAMLELLRAGWGRDNSTFRQLFTSTFLREGASREQIEWFDGLCLRATSAENAVRVLEIRSRLDVTGLLPQVRVPTLVLHARADSIAPLWQARMIAAAIPGAEFVELDSPNHILLAGEPAWQHFRDAVSRFCGLDAEAAPGGEHAAFAALSPRERDVLSLLTSGLANAQIAARLDISDKTVRNHLSSIFDKLGVWTRAQAIVFARDRGFAG